MQFSTLALTIFAAAASAQVTGALGDAPVTMGNSAAILYQATIMSANVMHAWFNFTGTSNGTGVMVSACFHGINADMPGPYGYHVHVNPTPENLNCTATGGHLDPYKRLQEPPCDSTMPKTCEVGDLSGKHGKVPVGYSQDKYCTSYVDQYLSLVEGNPAFIGNMRSVVIHAANTTRIGCGNITISNTPTPPMPTGNYTSAPVPTPTDSAAMKLGASGMFLAMVVTVGAILL